VERAERSEGLHKRSAEAWGHPLRARGAELPLAVFVVVFAFEKSGPALRAGTGPLGWGAENAGKIGGCSEGRAQHPSHSHGVLDRPTIQECQ
jgi:hypothetical protein